MAGSSACCKYFNIIILLLLLLNELTLAALGWSFSETFASLSIPLDNFTLLNNLKKGGFVFSGLTIVLLITIVLDNDDDNGEDIDDDNGEEFGVESDRLQKDQGMASKSKPKKFSHKNKLLLFSRLAIFCVKLFLTIWLYFFLFNLMFDNIEKLIKTSFKDFIKSNLSFNFSQKTLIHNFEKELQCCGLNNLSDWQGNQDELEFCKEFPEDEDSHYYNNGCNTAIESYIYFVEYIFSTAFYAFWFLLVSYGVCVIIVSMKFWCKKS